MNRRLVAVLSTVAVLSPALTAPSATARPGGNAKARPDQYRVAAGGTLHGRSVLANDRGDVTTVVRHTQPGHGTLALQPDGSFAYTATPGFTGTDTFTYTTTDAVHLYRTDLPPLATIDGVTITGGAYGSAVTPVPGHPDEVYGLTDRGPNADGPDGTKVEPLPSFTPAIGRFRLVRGQARLERTIPLRAADGTAYNGHTNCAANTGETITDLDGTVLPCSDTGYDPEGLVALRDGTFWVSDEYGPFVTHFDRNGRQIGRLTPFDRSLPRELANRVPNKGMEGLTVTPDGRTLVGIMQSALQQPDLTVKPSKVAPLRIVTIDLRTYAMHEYLYLLHDPDENSGAASEITALSNTEFLVDERDGELEPGAYKKLFRVDISRATDVGPSAAVAGATYDAKRGGLLLDGATIEATAGDADTAGARTALAGHGVRVAPSTLALDVAGVVTSLDPSGAFFGHDKIEGVAALRGGRTLIISNDSDFGIDGLANDTPPFQLNPKVLPDGTQDDGEYLAVDTTRLGDETTTGTVTITVR